MVKPSAVCNLIMYTPAAKSATSIRVVFPPLRTTSFTTSPIGLNTFTLILPFMLPKPKSTKVLAGFGYSAWKILLK